MTRRRKTPAPKPYNAQRTIYVSRDTDIALTRLGINKLSVLVRVLVDLADQSITIRELVQQAVDAEINPQTTTDEET